MENKRFIKAEAEIVIRYSQFTVLTLVMSRTLILYVAFVGSGNSSATVEAICEEPEEEEAPPETDILP